MNTNEAIIKYATDTLISESKSITDAVSNLNLDFAHAVMKISETKGRLVITGIGKSAHIATKIVATLNSTGTPSIFLHAAEAVHGDLGMVTKDDIILCISNSGNSPEIKVLVPLLKRDGNILIGMTANKESFLGKNSDFVINSYIERESCPNNLAPTNSTTLQLALGDAIAVSLMKIKDFTKNDFAKFHPGGALGKKLLLKVLHLLDNKNKPSVAPDASIKDVIVSISSKRLGVTVVVENEQIIGIITDGDIRRMLEKTDHFADLTAKDIMSRNPKTIDSNEMVAAALEILESFAITQLIVTENNKYGGIIHLHDILKEGIVS